MWADTLWMIAAIAAPVLLCLALGYAFVKNRRLSAIDRNDLREAIDDPFGDADQDEGPVRVDPERKTRVDMRPPTRASAIKRKGHETRRLSHG